MPTTLTNGLIGRRAVLEKNGVPIAALRTKSVSINNERVDITTDSDAGWAALLTADPAERSVEITADGIMKSNALLDEIVKADPEDDYLFKFGTMTKRFAGKFRLTNIEVGAPYNEAITISLTLQSSGEIVFATP